MPNLIRRPCNKAGCIEVTNKRFCALHEAEHNKDLNTMCDANRPNAYRRGYTAEWQKKSKIYLKAHPLCMCVGCDNGKLKITIATVVDHIVPHRGNMKLFWDKSNWQAMSKTCHDKKTRLGN